MLEEKWDKYYFCSCLGTHDEYYTAIIECDCEEDLYRKFFEKDKDAKYMLYHNFMHPVNAPHRFNTQKEAAINGMYFKIRKLKDIVLDMQEGSPPKSIANFSQSIEKEFDKYYYYEWHDIYYTGYAGIVAFPVSLEKISEKDVLLKKEFIGWNLDNISLEEFFSKERAFRVWPLQGKISRRQPISKSKLFRIHKILKKIIDLM